MSLPNIPTIWTTTTEIPSDFFNTFGYLPNDKIFIKPDTDASLNTAISPDNVHVQNYLIASNITKAFVGGATFYGCVFGGIQSLEEMGINAQCAIDLTDFDELDKSEHQEGQPYWDKEKISITTSQQLRQILVNRTRSLSFTP